MHTGSGEETSHNAHEKAFVACIADTAFWRPHILDVLRTHHLDCSCAEIEAGFNATHPTFICGDLVVKFFGHLESWRRAYQAELAAHSLIAADTCIAAPNLRASAKLPATALPYCAYLVTTRMRGISWERADLSLAEKRALAAELGAQVKHIHALPLNGAATTATWQTPAIAAACARSSLPPHLVAQIDEYVQSLEPFDNVFCHGDLVANHFYIEDSHLAGIIDWGDAMAMDRHYEIIQPFRDMFDCDKGLLRIFLDASDWPAGKHFHRQALGLALHRQAIGLQQHRSMDVFEPIALKFPLSDITTLDELAAELFAL